MVDNHVKPCALFPPIFFEMSRDVLQKRLMVNPVKFYGKDASEFLPQILTDHFFGCDAQYFFCCIIPVGNCPLLIHGKKAISHRFCDGRSAIVMVISLTL